MVAYRLAYDDGDRGCWVPWSHVLRQVANPRVRASNKHGGAYAVAFVEMKKNDRIRGHLGGI